MKSKHFDLNTWKYPNVCANCEKPFNFIRHVKDIVLIQFSSSKDKYGRIYKNVCD